jgi:hypothetical protein
VPRLLRRRRPVRRECSGHPSTVSATSRRGILRRTYRPSPRKLLALTPARGSRTNPARRNRSHRVGQNRLEPETWVVGPLSGVVGCASGTPLTHPTATATTATDTWPLARFRVWWVARRGRR